MVFKAELRRSLELYSRRRRSIVFPLHRHYVYYKHIRAEISAQFEYLINETESGRQSPMLMSWENVVAIEINTPCYLKR